MTTHPNPRAAVARTTVQLLTDRTFGPWFWGNVVSNSGNWLFNVTAAVVVFELSGSALLVGTVSVAQFLPLVLLSPFAGALSDRLDRRRLLLASQAFSATAAGALGLAALVIGVDDFPGTWPIILCAFGIGVGQSVAAPALNALVPALVDDVDLEGAVALTSVTFNVGRALGPATSGLLLATLGAEAAFVANGLSFFALIAALLVIRVQPAERAPGADRSVRAGLRFVRADRVTVLLLAGIAATGFAADPAITLAPPLAAELGGGETLTAILVSAFGIAAAPAAASSGRVARSLGGQRTAALGGSGIVLGLATTGLAPVATVAVIGFGITGAGFVFAVTGFTTLLQRRVPDAFRGRVMALWSVAFLGNRPIAATVDGAASDAFGPRLALLVAMTAAMAAVVIAWRLRHAEVDRRLDGEPSEPSDGADAT